MTDRVVLVTGATGIGAAVARLVGERGASVFVVSLNGQDVADLVDGLRDDRLDAAGTTADLTDESAAEEAFAICARTFRPPDGVVAVAGGSGRRQGDGPVADIPLSGWASTIEMNLTPAFLTVREAVRVMQRPAGRGDAPRSVDDGDPPAQPGNGGGSIVVVSSVLATHPSPLFVTHAYAAAKSAIGGFIRSVASRYAPDGVRVNAVAPGLVRTPMSERAASDPETVEYAHRKQPLAGGFLPPESVAGAVGFLLGPDSRHVTGQVLEVDGGWGVTEPRN